MLILHLTQVLDILLRLCIIAADDHAAGNGDNNASYREIGFNSISDPYVLANGPQETIAGDPAIRAWAAIDPNVSITENTCSWRWLDFARLKSY